MKPAGERSAGNPLATFEVAGAGNGLTVRIVRHSQRKRGETDRPNLRSTAPVLDPTNLAFQEAHGVGRPEGNKAACGSASMQRSCGVEDPKHAVKLHAREPGGPVVAHKQYSGPEGERDER